MTSESFLLSDEERGRFARWLHRQAESNEGVIKQFDKLPHGEILVKKLRMETAAYWIVARILDETESMTVTGAELTEEGR